MDLRSGIKRQLTVALRSVCRAGMNGVHYKPLHDNKSARRGSD
jgi:hypothetical protein